MALHVESIVNNLGTSEDLRNVEVVGRKIFLVCISLAVVIWNTFGKVANTVQGNYAITFIVTNENSYMLESHLLCFVYAYLHDTKVKKILAT